MQCKMYYKANMMICVYDLFCCFCRLRAFFLAAISGLATASMARLALRSSRASRLRWRTR